VVLGGREISGRKRGGFNGEIQLSFQGIKRKTGGRGAKINHGESATAGESGEGREHY